MSRYWALCIDMQKDLDGQFTMVLRDDVDGLRLSKQSVRGFKFAAICGALHRCTFLYPSSMWQVFTRHPRTRMTVVAYAAYLGRERCLQFLCTLASTDDLQRIGKRYTRNIIMYGGPVRGLESMHVCTLALGEDLL